jgi:hypothetical protein
LSVVNDGPTTKTKANNLFIVGAGFIPAQKAFVEAIKAFGRII